MQDTPLKDKFGRPFQDLRISVTDRCNFRCRYCMPKEIFGPDFSFLPKEHLLSFEEIERLAKLFVQLGVKKIRLTGGEPLLRRNLSLLIQKLSNIDGLDDIALTTNAYMLENHAEKLKDAGLKRVNVSLDAIDDETFKSINDVGAKTNRVLKGIHKAKEVGLEVKVNMVVKKGMNDHEVIPMAKYFKEHEITLRYIEFMDVGQTNGWDFSQVVTKKALFQQLNEHFKLEPVEPAYKGEVAQRYRYAGTDTEVGFITSVSESFCSTCTRGRLSADGKFFTCLFATDGLNLKELLRTGATDDEIISAFTPTWENRTDRYSDERTEESVKNRPKIEMSYIGG
ncbi:GTP 3',8-cyclase MoaA [Salinibacillus aidingensis]|uniref:GTP 3',8-cyclase n=1 Tax=Salinibacillus aidingensis TaxID=237684 RepID=A0ABN1BNM2_9BACI